MLFHYLRYHKEIQNSFENYYSIRKRRNVNQIGYRSRQDLLC